MTERKPLAPFRVKTKSGNHYYVKLVDRTNDAAAVGVYVRGGEVIEIKVPLGAYEMRYATRRTWCGEEQRFGWDTSYFRSDDPFIFSAHQQLEGIDYAGYTIELILQSDGNLRTIPISPEHF